MPDKFVTVHWRFDQKEREDIDRRLGMAEPPKQIAREYGVKPRVIRKLWKRITKPVSEPAVRT